MRPGLPLVRFAACPDPRVLLVCFPHAGAGATAFQPWTRRFGSTVDIVAVRAAGRESRLVEPPPAGVTEVAHEVAGALLTTTATPTVLFGHSLGALVAYETALLLQEHGQDARAVVLSGCEPPGAGDAPPRVDDMTDAAFVEELRSYGGTPAQILDIPDLLTLLLPALRADFRAAETYRPSHRDLAAPVVVITGADDRVTDPVAAAGWQGLCAGPWEHVTVPGDHFYPFTTPAPTDDVLRAVLDRAAAADQPAPRLQLRLQLQPQLQLQGAVSP